MLLDEAGYGRLTSRCVDVVKVVGRIFSPCARRTGLALAFLGRLRWMERMLETSTSPLSRTLDVYHLQAGRDSDEESGMRRDLA